MRAYATPRVPAIQRARRLAGVTAARAAMVEGLPTHDRLAWRPARANSRLVIDDGTLDRFRRSVVDGAPVRARVAPGAFGADPRGDGVLLALVAGAGPVAVRGRRRAAV